MWVRYRFPFLLWLYAMFFIKRSANQHGWSNHQYVKTVLCLDIIVKKVLETGLCMFLWNSVEWTGRLMVRTKNSPDKIVKLQWRSHNNCRHSTIYNYWRIGTNGKWAKASLVKFPHSTEILFSDGRIDITYFFEMPKYAQVVSLTRSTLPVSWKRT